MRQRIDMPVWLVALMAGLLFFHVVTDTHGWENWLALLVIALVCGIGYKVGEKQEKPEAERGSPISDGYPLDSAELDDTRLLGDQARLRLKSLGDE